MEEGIQSTFRDYAWKYFALHADQRLKTFNFYLIVATLIVGAFATLLKEAKDWRWLSILPFLLTFLSFVFWKLDLRNKQLVRNGETALKFLDEQSGVQDNGDEPHVLKLFAHNDYVTKARKRYPDVSPLEAHFSYSTCFYCVFLVFGVSSFILGLFCLFKGHA